MSWTFFFFFWNLKKIKKHRAIDVEPNTISDVELLNKATAQTKPLFLVHEKFIVERILSVRISRTSQTRNRQRQTLASWSLRRSSRASAPGDRSNQHWCWCVQTQILCLLLFRENNKIQIISFIILLNSEPTTANVGSSKTSADYWEEEKDLFSLINK